MRSTLSASHLGAERRPTWLSAFEIAVPIVFTLLLFALALRAAPLVHRLELWPHLGLAAVLAYLAADLATGIVHWFCDTFYSEETTIIGRALIEPFREHHRDPLAITRRGFFEVNSSNCLAMIPVLAAAYWRGGSVHDGPTAALADGFLLCLAPAVSLTNQFHKWAHAPRVPRIVGWLQRARLILPPSHHARHHQPGESRAFCVTSGWCDPLLDRLEVFPRLERRLRALRPPGAIVHRKSAGPSAPDSEGAESA